MMLFHAVPDSEGKKNAIARSKQLTDFCWTPIKDVPSFRKSQRILLPAGIPITGMPYSSLEISDRFLAENVSFETFFSMAANPDSALYMKDMGGGYDGKIWTMTGIVCNGLVRYAFDIRRRISTKRWFTVPGMKEIAPPRGYSVDEIELCDVLYAFGNGRNHVSLITDILRDEQGAIRQIEVSEAVRPSCKRACYPVEEFYEKYKLFGLCRYEYVDEVPAPDEDVTEAIRRGVPKTPPLLALDFGNKTNYREGEEILFSVFADDEQLIELYRDDQLTEQFRIAPNKPVIRTFSRGYYAAKVRGCEHSVEFCVTSPGVSYSIADGMITVEVKSNDPCSRILYMDFREEAKTEGAVSASLSRYEELTEEEKATGHIVRAIPEDGKNIKVYFENKYGVWSHPMIGIF